MPTNGRLQCKLYYGPRSIMSDVTRLRLPASYITHDTVTDPTTTTNGNIRYKTIVFRREGEETDRVPDIAHGWTKSQGTLGGISKLTVGIPCSRLRTKSKIWDVTYRLISTEGETGVVQFNRERKIFRSTYVKSCK